jgi:hypothetical protein
MATPVKDWLPLKQRALWVIFGKVVPEIEGGISSDLHLARVIAKTFPLEQQAPADGKPLDQRFSDAMRKWSQIRARPVVQREEAPELFDDINACHH